MELLAMKNTISEMKSKQMEFKANQTLQRKKLVKLKMRQQKPYKMKHREGKKDNKEKRNEQKKLNKISIICGAISSGLTYM